MNQKVHRKGAPSAWRDPKTGYTKEKDMSGHAGKEWKIRDKSGKRKDLNWHLNQKRTFRRELKQQRIGLKHCLLRYFLTRKNYR